VKVPDIGDFKDVPIIEVHVRKGDAVNADDPLITLESDKASMEVPAPIAGTVQELYVTVGDRVSEGRPILALEAGDGALAQPPSLVGQQEPPLAAQPPPSPAAPAPVDRAPIVDFDRVHASPSVRRAARELGVDLAKIKGTGEKGRITKEDVIAFLKGPAVPAAPAQVPAGAGIPEIPPQDFARFGPVEKKPLSRIKRISGPHLHRAWLNLPHVTQQDEADITDLEAYRKELDAAARDEGYRVTLLAFLMRASVSALKQFPEFNSSLSPEKDSLILKRYCHIGIAVDTPDGLVVPVIRDVDRKGITELSQETRRSIPEGPGGQTRTVGSAGWKFHYLEPRRHWGTGFTPIINAPEVAILGVVRSKTAPVWNGESFAPRLMLPLSLSYDHRVIDGAQAARFARHLCHVLEDVRRLVL
jgi:pyruvate dehydrogenase E2 component (dihydrolipoamide acetyltransferase)